MTTRKDFCLTALTIAHKVKNGEVVDLGQASKWLDNHAPDDTYHTHGVFAKALNDMAPAIEVTDYKPKGKMARLLFMLEKRGFPVGGLAKVLVDAEHVYGTKVVDDINKIFNDFTDQKGMYELIQSNPQEARKLWKENYAPKIKDYAEAMMVEYEKSQDLPLKQFTEDYFEGLISGDPIFGSGKVGPFTKLTKNVVSNLVKQPVISAYNVYEIGTKPLAIAAEAGDMGAALRAMGRFNKALKENKVNFWQRIPELEAKGVYGFKSESDVKNPILKAYVKGIDTAFAATENPLRAIAYYTGEELGKGGQWGLEKIAFIASPANTPIALRGGDEGALALMRFGLSSTRMYGNWAYRAFKGDKSAQAGLATYMALSFLLAGTRNTVPAPVDALMQKLFGEEYINFANAVDVVSPIGSASKAVFGPEFLALQPLSMPALGLGYQISSTVLNSVGRDSNKALAKLAQGDVVAVAALTGKVLTGLAMFGQVPGMDINTNRLMSTMAEIAQGEIEADLGSASADFAERSNLYNPAKSEYGR